VAAQYRRFVELVGRPPPVVNAHQHVALFPPVGGLLRRLLEPVRPTPFVRRVVEPAATLLRVRGARFKRAALASLGWLQAPGLARAGFPAADWLVGITDPRWVRDPAFFPRLLARAPGRAVELICHPGRPDPTLSGRDGDGPQPRREQELGLLGGPSFDEACRRAGFRRVTPSEWAGRVRALAA
jgi:predicted glycoside hydrolase/deacetylase ChbG (UPF0249 family)